MSFKIQKGNYTNTINFATLSANRTITFPNSNGTVALTNQFSTVATSGSYNDLSGKPTLATVATSGSYNDLSNKPNIPASMQGYITKAWMSGSNWYRVWSNGWIEQGGTYPAGDGKTVNLHLSFSDTNYSVYNTGAVKILSKATNSFKSDSNYGYQMKSDGYWFAIGK